MADFVRVTITETGAAAYVNVDNVRYLQRDRDGVSTMVWFDDKHSISVKEDMAAIHQSSAKR